MLGWFRRLIPQSGDFSSAGGDSYGPVEKGDTLGYIVDREIYKHLERIADAFEDVANEIDGLVIEHS